MTSSLKDANFNPNAQWMRDAKWGFFTYYLAHMASELTIFLPKNQWNEKVNSFDVKHACYPLALLSFN